MPLNPPTSTPPFSTQPFRIIDRSGGDNRVRTLVKCFTLSFRRFLADKNALGSLVGRAPGDVCVTADARQVTFRDESLQSVTGPGRWGDETTYSPLT